MALVEVDYSYKVKEWDKATFEVDDPSDTNLIESMTRDFMEDIFKYDDGAEVSGIEVENIREIKELIS